MHLATVKRNVSSKSLNLEIPTLSWHWHRPPSGLFALRACAPDRRPDAPAPGLGCALWTRPDFRPKSNKKGVVVQSHSDTPRPRPGLEQNGFCCSVLGWPGVAPSGGGPPAVRPPLPLCGPLAPASLWVRPGCLPGRGAARSWPVAAAWPLLGPGFPLSRRQLAGLPAPLPLDGGPGPWPCRPPGSAFPAVGLPPLPARPGPGRVRGGRAGDRAALVGGFPFSAASARRRTPFELPV